ncbi:MAG: ArsR family transcriptional regulator [Chloroflexota bacterium]|nr:ArsR family transcriptional regulator [Chloroflexota bacterium]
MLRAPLGQRFFATTRGRIVLLVRRAPRTIDELCQALGLTRNAVRAHLATLERDGLVRRNGLRPGTSKPSQLYALTPEAAELFPRAYAPVLERLLRVLSQVLPPEVLEGSLRDVGRQMALERPVPRGGIRERAVVGAAVLDDLGGMADIREVDGALWIQVWNCPLAAVVVAHPELCRLMETLLAELLGATVRQRCDVREPPRCSFEVVGAAGAGGRRDRASGQMRS